MLTAVDLKEGMAIHLEGQIYRVLAVESKAGAAKLGGVVKTKLSNVVNGHIWEPHFRPQERMEEVELERRLMEYVFSSGDTCTFMNPETFEQIEIPKTVVGSAETFLRSGMEIPVEFFGGQPLAVLFPDAVEIGVRQTAPAAHAQQETAWKQATLENGMNIQVPMFVGPGEILRVEVRTGRYLERVRAVHKRGA